MPFSANRLINGDWEVTMKASTFFGRVNYGHEDRRRFAYCTHENDAEVIVDALNAAEQRGELR